MILIYTAMYHEAKPVIDHFRLQKAALPPPIPGRLQWFAGTSERLGRPVHLVVGGTGPLAAAVGTTYALTRAFAFRDMQEAAGNMPTVFLNLGIGGTIRADWPVGEVILCHKIIHHDTGRAYFPDILIRHPFREGVLETFSKPVANTATTKRDGTESEKEAADVVAGDVVDMEGAGCFEAAAAFLAPHRMFFVKVVSDHVDIKLPGGKPESARPSSITARSSSTAGSSSITAKTSSKADVLDGPAVSRLIAENLPAVETLLFRVQEMEAGAAAPLLNPEEEQLLRTLAEQLRLSVTMSHQFRHLCLQYKAAGGHDLAERLRPRLRQPVPSKQERKRVFEQIRQELLPD